ncbi:MAG: potassium-transporting ATPase subunit C [Verrucomicrobiaceae bacterium]|jgi:K+-transporting ATPase ATPase C chain|nr:MAG: potassium-transporting ATPase subunit C [Verrucomicrobiaceae bacterium]
MSIIRLTLLSIIICGFAYVPAVLGFAKTMAPEKASGSLVHDSEGKVIGSSLVAQAFTSPRYFHPRPSACDYNAQGAAGSNLSPKNPELATRAEAIITAQAGDGPIPADLVTASGSGLDPHISRAAAIYQVERVAAERKVSRETVEALIPETELVNVLELNIALER